MTRTEERKRATELKAVDVRELIRTQLPAVMKQLTAAQVDQLQRVLDVAVIDADIETRGWQLDSQSIKGRIVHSSQYLRDPAIVAQRNKVLQQKITLKPGENAIGLDHRKLLTFDALKPTSDNPDEAAYLLVVAEIYEYRGIWLVLDSSMGAMTQQMNATDPRKWRVRLLLGYKRGELVEEIKSAGGNLDRHALLSVSRLGAGYYKWVHQGPTMTSLKNVLDRLSDQITKGRNEHYWWSSHRSEYYVTSRVSDKFGGADWPSESIWDQPHQIYVKALNLINDGKLAESGEFALLAAYQAWWSARAVHEYVAATTKGASRVVTILGVVETITEIIGLILSIMEVGYGVIRLLSREGGALALESGAAQRQLTGGKQQLRLPAPAEPTPAPSPQTGRGGTLVDASQPPLPPSKIKAPAGPGPRTRWDALQNAARQLRQEMGLPLANRTIQGPLGAYNRSEEAARLWNFMDWLGANPNASFAEKLAQFEKDILVYRRRRP